MRLHAVCHLRVGAMTAGLVAALAPAAWAQSNDDDDEPAAGDTARSAADAGGFATWTMSARSDAQKGLVLVTGGYDGGRDGAQFESVLEARLYGPLSFRAGGSYIGPDGEMRPIFTAKVDALRQERQGVDLAIAGGYEPNGFNTVPAVVVNAAVSRRIDQLRLQSNLGVGTGLEENELYGDARLAALYRLGDRVQAGVDSRLRVDLERDTDEPEGEPDWELVAGPLTTVTIGRFAVTGGVGLSATRLRLETKTSVGPLGYMGVGAVF